MFSIEVKGHFSAAHFLEDYEGLCGSIHGHRWEVILSVRLNQDLETQMLVDFKDLKQSLNELMNQMDHSFILDPEGNERSRAFYNLAKSFDMRVYEMKGRTTAENIARHIWDYIQRETGWSTHSIQVFEAPNNAVTFRGE